MVMGFWNAGFGKTQNSHLIRHAMRKPCGSICQNCPGLRSFWSANARCCWRVDSQALLSHFKMLLKHLNTKIKENWKSSILLSVFRTAEKAIFTHKTVVVFFLNILATPCISKVEVCLFWNISKDCSDCSDCSASTSRQDGNLCDVSQPWHLQTMKQEFYSISCLWLVENKCLKIPQCLAC